MSYPSKINERSLNDLKSRTGTEHLIPVENYTCASHTTTCTYTLDQVHTYVNHVGSMMRIHTFKRGSQRDSNSTLRDVIVKKTALLDLTAACCSTTFSQPLAFHETTQTQFTQYILHFSTAIYGCTERC